MWRNLLIRPSEQTEKKNQGEAVRTVGEGAKKTQIIFFFWNECAAINECVCVCACFLKNCSFIHPVSHLAKKKSLFLLHRLTNLCPIGQSVDILGSSALL